MINFDNAATTYPKPKNVRDAVSDAMVLYGGNAGRGGHILAERTSEMVYSVREAAAEFFDAKPENTILCLNCTHALNTAILGILEKGDHVIISSLEHNSVYRPVAALVKKGTVTCTIAEVSDDDTVTLENVRRSIRPETKAVIFTMASNVTGQITPIREIGRLCKEKGICLIADGAQLCGVMPVSLEKDNISILCTSGHKGLYGITGTGLLMTDCKFPIKPLMYGGTGSASASPEQPDFLPDRLESGTQNIIGAASVKAGLAFLRRYGLSMIYEHEQNLCRIFLKGVSAIPEIKIYRMKKPSYVPIVSFNVDGSAPEETAEFLSREGFCLRAGLHCAPLAHNSNGTPEGTVRFAPSVMNSEREVMLLVQTVKKYVRNIKSSKKVLKSSTEI